MYLKQARVTEYRSIRDTGWFDVEEFKTILVGPNEAGKTALLQALQQLNPPDGIGGFDPLRDYPRRDYDDVRRGKVDPSDITIVQAIFELDEDDYKNIPDEFSEITYECGKRLNNQFWHRINGGPEVQTYGDIQSDLQRLASHIDSQFAKHHTEETLNTVKPSEKLSEITSNWSKKSKISRSNATALNEWLKTNITYVDEDNEKEEKRLIALQDVCDIPNRRQSILQKLQDRLPVFVLFSNYFRVHPIIHLGKLATRIEKNALEDDTYDYGNQCLLKFLGFSARELSNLGKVSDDQNANVTIENYRQKLDERQYSLNSASIKLTEEIQRVWVPDKKRDEADVLRLTADQQYLKVVVEDDLGVEIELNQRSEGFQWLVSFFVVFFAEAIDKHENSILLLDEPGLSLHGLKQREFRKTISRLAENNQTLYTTHSPFLVGPDELHLVRVVEMTDRKIGTKVHTNITASDSAALLPLQEALGYDLAQSLFSQERNLVLEGLTDYWYLDAVSQLLEADNIISLNPKIALIPANSAGKVVYFATILHAHNLKVAALLDSDRAGDQVAKQDNLVHQLGNKAILRTQDVYKGSVKNTEIEDLLRETLVNIAKDELGWDVKSTASKQIARPIVDVFTNEIDKFSKYKLAKAFLKWCRANTANDLTPDEVEQFKNLIEKVNKVLK